MSMSTLHWNPSVHHLEGFYRGVELERGRLYEFKVAGHVCVGEWRGVARSPDGEHYEPEFREPLTNRALSAEFALWFRVLTSVPQRPSTLHLIDSDPATLNRRRAA